MENLSLIKKIELLAKEKYPHWIHSGDIEIFAQNEGYKASHGDRRARDLVARGILERVKEGVSVKYRFIQKDYFAPTMPTFAPKTPEQVMSIVERINAIPAKKPQKISEMLF